MGPRSTRRRGNTSRLIAVGVGIVILHLLLSLSFPEAAWITPVVWISLYALALSVTIRQIQRSDAATRWKWDLIATNFTLSIVSFLCILYAEYVFHGSATAAWLNALMRAWKSLALLLAVCTPEEAERPLNRVLDILQALVIASIFFFLFSPGLFHQTFSIVTPDSILVNRYNYAQAAILALLTVLAVFTARTRDSRLFHTVLGIYLWVGVPISIFTNEFLINRWTLPPASWLFVPSDFCLVAFIVAVPLLRRWLAARWRPGDPSPRLVFVRLGSSALLPFFGMLASMLLAVADKHPLLGIATGTTTLAIYGLRSTSGQFQLLAIQSNLQITNRRLELLSQRDPLTALYNRRWFDEHFALEWKRAQRGNDPISLLLIDIDHFKLYNDTLGHAQGDLCLQAVAGIFADFVARDNDALVRFGGEEFLAMLPSTGVAGALQIAQAMKSALDARGIPHPSSPQGRVTVSIGIATAQSPGPDVPAVHLVVRADQALYRAKAEGRNRIHQA